MLPSEAADISY